MKSTVLLLGAASLGFALLQVQPGQKLPFIPAPKGSGKTCPVRDRGKGLASYSEDMCGTKRFCRAIGASGLNSTQFVFDPKPKWNTTEACFEEHEPEPRQELLPFDFGTLSDCDKTITISEECMGTETYCKNIDEIVEYDASEGIHRYGEDEDQTGDIRWLSTDECLKGHVPEPKDLPFLEGNTAKECGADGDESEETCGTLAFCNLFSQPPLYGKKRQACGSPYIWSKRQCLAAHQEKPTVAHQEKPTAAPVSTLSPDRIVSPDN